MYTDPVLHDGLRDACMIERPDRLAALRRGGGLGCLISAFIVQVQRQRGQDVGVLKGSVDDATGARGVLDGVRDPPPRGATTEMPSGPAVLGGVPAAGRGGHPAAGHVGGNVSPATTPESSLGRPLRCSCQEEERVTALEK